MSRKQSAPRVNKLPFLLTDLVFIGVALGIIYRSQTPLGGGQIFAVIACVALGAWACVTPFLRDHDVEVRLAESDNLTDTVQQIRQLKDVGLSVQTATARWQIFQENSTETSAAMQRMANQLSNDARNFAETLKQANDIEKTALRLEVDKRKRTESDWLKIMVTLLDHVNALYQAGVRSGQQNVIQQLGSFQAACRDVVRRVGLVAIEAQAGEVFNPDSHRLPDEQQAVPEGALIASMLATGFSFQGQLVRPVLVTLAGQPTRPGSPATAEGPAVEVSNESSPSDEPSLSEGEETAFDSDSAPTGSRPPIV